MTDKRSKGAKRSAACVGHFVLGELGASLRRKLARQKASID
jgi:hypothetical protein